MAQNQKGNLWRFLRGPVIVLLALAACGQPGGTDTTAASLMPQLPDYNTMDTLDIQDAITKLAGAASLGAGQPEITALVAGANGLTACYQRAGAIQGRAFVNKADPTKAGVVVIINRNRLTDPVLFLSCVAPPGAMGVMSIQPCAKAYTLKRDNNEFYIGYVATNEDVCSTFCSSLQGCVP